MTLRGLTIALTGLPPSLGAAFQSWLHHTGGATVMVCNTIIPDCDSADMMITAPDFFLGHLDYFLPRKNRIAILSHGQQFKDAPVPILNLEYEPEELLQSISHISRIPLKDEPENKTLTQREIDVLKEIASGKINKEIAEALNISVNTVITHRKNLSTKLGIRSVSGLSLYAVMNGII